MKIRQDERGVLHARRDVRLQSALVFIDDFNELVEIIYERFQIFITSNQRIGDNQGNP